MAAAQATSGKISSSSIPTQRRALATAAASGCHAASALLARAYLMKAIVGRMEIRPIRVKIASLAQKKGLAS